eukprot:TRINITY_DN9785_c0_g1_i1.p1 TRINITY_DN9785_c0_g1~~TRINITY_DN9785_c0_g1_i1.p1  ORF type:complete len:1112 (+),score=327.76 TRINITY_DN9785_c0_g1_i1:449-3337(+)
MVKVLEVVELPEAKRIRARLEFPEGWISLQNTASGLRWADKLDDKPGSYIISREAFLTSTCENFSPEDDEILEELEPDYEVEVLEVVHLCQDFRVRARIAEPSGWITLLNAETGRRWAEKKNRSKKPQATLKKSRSWIEKNIEAAAQEKAAAKMIQDYGPGVYLLTREVFVSPEVDLIAPDEEETVAELGEGEMVRVVETVALQAEKRLRARIDEPEGWISLVNLETCDRWAEKQDDAPGMHVLVNKVFLSPTVDNLNPDIDDQVDELEPGLEVNIVEIAHLIPEQRVRARLEKPDGWMTLMNTMTGKRWAEKASPLLNEDDHVNSPQEPLQEPMTEEQPEESLSLSPETQKAHEQEEQPEESLSLSPETQKAHEQEVVTEAEMQGEQKESEHACEQEEGEQEPGHEQNHLEQNDVEQRQIHASSEQTIDEDNGIDRDVPGYYILTKMAFVSPECELLDPDDDELVDELEPGTEIKIVELVELPQDQRLRARLLRPEGWITLLNFGTGTRFAKKQIDEEELEKILQQEEEAEKEDEAEDRLKTPDEASAAGAPKTQNQAESSEEDKPGKYLLTRTCFVSPEADLLDPDDDELVDELDEGLEVNIVEILHLEEENRLRARLENPDGWFTLMNTETGKRWAERQFHEDELVERLKTPEEEQSIMKRQISGGLKSYFGSPEFVFGPDGEAIEVQPPERVPQVIVHDEPGHYVLTHFCFVAEVVDDLDPDDDDLVDELEEGTEVEILEIVHLKEEKRVRALLAEPDGWITLENLETGKRWAEKEDMSWFVDSPGNYVLSRLACVGPCVDNLNPDDDELVDELFEGTVIRVAEVVYLRPEKRVRALLEHPVEGWITLMNVASGKRWAERNDNKEVPGAFVLLSTAAVSPSASWLAPGEEELVGELETGTHVDVVEVVELRDGKLFRGRIRQPAGWISIKNLETGDRWAVRQENGAGTEARRLSFQLR